MPQTVTGKRNLEIATLADAAMLQPRAHLRGARMDHFTAQPFSRLFEEQVSSFHHQPAVIYENETLTFAELNTRANQLAHYLQSLGAGAESLIGICVERSLDMAVGILGILKSGAAYLPLDPEYPRERLAFMVDDARPALVLTKSALADRVSGNAARAVLLDNDRARLSEQSTANLSAAPRPDDLAYVIYTSGSTGKPKGVMITHGNLANYLLALDHELQITRADLYLHTASIAFSSSRRQLMLPLSQGATVVIATSEQRKDPLALFAMIKQRRVTIMDAVPSFWRNCTAILANLDGETRLRLLDNNLRLMLSASEPLRSDIPRTWAAEFGHPARHVHMFGQTETAGIVALYRIPPDIGGARAVPVGRPIANSEIFILDEAQRPCPVGVAGEVYIGGAGVGRGYLNSAEQTSAKFIAHPFNETPGARLYRTGDWARLNADGQIEFVGRRDQQVKLRGFRVELGEIEAALAGHPKIRECAVVARDDPNGEQRLIAYFVAESAAPGVTELRAFMSGQLPDYVVPSVFVKLDALPLSANGKINRLALPEPDNTRAELAADYVAPRTASEKLLSEIWSEVLQIEHIGTHDNFFELGGNSLLATLVCSRVRNALKIEVPPRLLFERPTVALMAGAIGTAAAATPLEIRPHRTVGRNGTAPLSFPQQQFWLLDQAEPNSSHYNVRAAIKVAGPLEVAKLRQAFAAIVAQHEILRTTFVLNDGSPVQSIAPSLPFALDVSDLSTLEATERDRKVQHLLAAEAGEHFDLAHGPLFRARLLKLGTDEHLLLVTLHHIICDGWSVDVLLRELMTRYQSDASATQLPLQYADFSLWQRERFQSGALTGQMDYWKRKLANAPAALELPTDYRRPQTRTFNGAQESVLLSADLSRGVKALSRREGATLFMTLLAAFQTLLSRYSGQDDIVVGSPIAGRTQVETENLIGAFVNTLALRGDLSGNPTFREFLNRVRETALEGYTHQEVPFEKLVEELRPDRSLNRTPLFQAMFTLQNPPAEITAAGLRWSALQLDRTKSKFDLTLEIEKQSNGLRASLEYNTDLFAPATMQRMLEHFQNLLTTIVAHPDEKLSDLSLLSESELEKLLVEWNDTAAEFSSDTCIHELFEAQAARTPDAVAAEFRGEQLSYRELNGRANQLAHYLGKQGVGPEVLVGVCVERSFEMLVSILAVLKAGGAYVPLDPTYPPERIAFMIEDAGLSLLLTQASVATRLPRTPRRYDDSPLPLGDGLGERDCDAVSPRPSPPPKGEGNETSLVLLDQDWEIISRESEQSPVIEITPQNLAYIIYTSGSTGNPKGVAVEHRSLVNFVEAAMAAYEIKSGDRVLQFASLNFDLSAEEIYPALICGATVVLRTDEMISSPRDFLNQCGAWRVSVLDLPTAYWHELTDALDQEGMTLPTSFRLVIIGGEKALLERVRVWQRLAGESVRLVNSYGPTETTVVATLCDLRQDRGNGLRQNVSIGRPILNTTVFVLDELRRPVPIGVPGELYIGGAGVARGYLNRPELTAEKFISDPFSKVANAKLYRTGDLVRYDADGNIEFVGRVDNQIKIRGFRVELGEIEQALRNHPRVSDVVVVLFEDDAGEKRLVVYVVPAGEAQLTLAELRNFLKAKLPSYMLPTALETIAALPLLPNGKIDRRALPEPRQVRPETYEGFVAPRTLMETLLASGWCEALRLERVGVHDNFFELGGHSLLAARVVSNLRHSMKIEFGMVDVLRSPTIAELAALLEARRPRDEQESDLALLLAELAGLSDEEAQQRLTSELAKNETELTSYA